MRFARWQLRCPLAPPLYVCVIRENLLYMPVLEALQASPLTMSLAEIFLESASSFGLRLTRGFSRRSKGVRQHKYRLALGIFGRRFVSMNWTEGYLQVSRKSLLYVTYCGDMVSSMNVRRRESMEYGHTSLIAPFLRWVGDLRDWSVYAP